jgi:hypothetical protein
MALAPTTLVGLERQLDALPTVLGPDGPEALRRNPAAGGWSALENLAHLGRHHEMMRERLTPSQSPSGSSSSSSTRPTTSTSR